jgi:hypothetical protein
VDRTAAERERRVLQHVTSEAVARLNDLTHASAAQVPPPLTLYYSPTPLPLSSPTYPYSALVNPSLDHPPSPTHDA